MGAALSIFVLLSISVFVIRVASVALRLTGLAEDSARFQALSAFTGSVSAPFWGYLCDTSSRKVMALASSGAGLLGILTYLAIHLNWGLLSSEIGLAAIFLLLNVMHGGVRLRRKVYLVDMASADNRAAFVAVSNTVVGVMILVAGSIGLVADWRLGLWPIFIRRSWKHLRP